MPGFMCGSAQHSVCGEWEGEGGTVQYPGTWSGSGKRIGSVVAAAAEKVLAPIRPPRSKVQCPGDGSECGMRSMKCTLVLLNSVANWSKLLRAWHKGFLTSDPTSTSRIKSAIERNVSLLQYNVASVPFVYRYRADVIAPLLTKQVHTLSHYMQKRCD